MQSGVLCSEEGDYKTGYGGVIGGGVRWGWGEGVKCVFVVVGNVLWVIF